MAHAIPLVRAIALLPSLRWLAARDLPAEQMLRAQGLGCVLSCSPLRPVALLKVGALLRDLARAHGPDVACRIVAEAKDADLVQVGRVALGAASPAAALARISFALPYFCSHELLSLDNEADTVVVRHSYGAGFDPETLHLMSQYALAVLDRICAMSKAPAPRILAAQMPAHPQHGLAHLAPWFEATALEAAKGGSLCVRLARDVADRPFPTYARDRSAELARAGLQPLRDSDGFAGSVRMVLEYILEDEGAVPSVARVADAAGLSPRSLQRRLQQEQHSFKSLLDQVRQAQAQRLIAESAETVTSVADRLGYAQPTSLNRAMLRWTGRSPTSYRNHGS